MSDSIYNLYQEVDQEKLNLSNIEFYDTKIHTMTTRCVLCREHYTEKDGVATLKCKHYFHSTCILEWSERPKNIIFDAICPLCGRKI